MKTPRQVFCYVRVRNVGRARRSSACLVVALGALASCASPPATTEAPSERPSEKPPAPAPSHDRPVVLTGSRADPPAAPRESAPSLRVLFVGDSYTFVNDLPKWVRDVVTSSGAVSIEIDSIVQGGATLTQHVKSPAVTERIGRGGWTHVVIQAQGVEPLLDPAGFESGAAALAAEARKAGAVPVFYETWARRAGDPVYREAWSGGTPPEMQARLDSETRKVAAANGGLLVPAGAAFAKALGDRRLSVTLLASDGSNPTVAGTYLVACIFYARLTGRSPVGVSARPSSLAAGDAAALQELARKVASEP
jgi:hypothetical protein